MNNFVISGYLKGMSGDIRGLMTDFTNKIANKKVFSEVTEYNETGEKMSLMITLMMISFNGIFVNDEIETKETEKEMEERKEFFEKIEKTEIYKRLQN